jgi:hypothetical protein
MAAMAADEANGLLLFISKLRRSIPLRKTLRIMLNFGMKVQRKGAWRHGFLFLIHPSSFYRGQVAVNRSLGAASFESTR